MCKKIIIYSTLLAILTACNLNEKIAELTTFEIENSASFTVPSSTIVDLPVTIPTPDVNSSSQKTFENENTRADLVEDINLKSLTLTITDPNDRTFAFLKSIKIYISNDEQGETLLAERMDIPENIGDVLELETTGATLDEYVKKETYDLKHEVVTRSSVGSSTDINAEMVFEVRAKLL